MLGKIVAQRVRAGGIAVMDDEHRDAQVHQGKRHGVPGAPGADLHDGCPLRAVTAKTFLETATPSASVEIIPGSAAVRRDGNSVDGANLDGFGIGRIEKWQD